jgi:hypothetical protein
MTEIDCRFGTGGSPIVIVASSVTPCIASNHSVAGISPSLTRCAYIGGPLHLRPMWAALPPKAASQASQSRIRPASATYATRSSPGISLTQMSFLFFC